MDDPTAIPPPPWRHEGPRPSRWREIEVVADRQLPVTVEAARAVVCDISSIADSELKAHEVEVSPTGPDTGTYWVRGSFAGVPWTGRFRYRLHEAGFHSVNIDRRRFGIDISGGFVVTAGSAPDTCRLRHYEQYLLPWRLVPLRPVLTAFLRHSMVPELARIVEMSRSAPR